ncbi:MAG: hypothetical protein J6L77_06245 [Coprococcus sp.]|nr:hypothetical protein [Coprococcus sp.]
MTSSMRLAEMKAEGIAKGKADIILNMYKKGYPLEEISDIVDKNIEEIKAIIENKEAILI